MVRAHCPRCDRHVHVGPLEVTVMCGSQADDSEFVLDCPSCSHLVRGHVHRRMAMELATSGARLLDRDRALNDSEIERFAAALENPAAVERELASFIH